MTFVHTNRFLTMKQAIITCSKRSRKQNFSTNKSSTFPVATITGSSWIDGPGYQLGTGKIGNQAHQTIVGAAGSTVIFCSVVKNPTSNFLSVDYRQRFHGVGAIPPNKLRRDNAHRPTAIEILRGRAIDRALRPFVNEGFHLHASLQSYDPWGKRKGALLENGDLDSSNSVVGSSSGHPVALAIHAAAAALSISDSVGAVVVCLDQDGNVHQDPTPQQSADSLGELLYVGTPDDRIVTMEWTSHQTESLPENILMELIDASQASLRLNYFDRNLRLSLNDKYLNESDLRADLGLPPTETLDLQEKIKEKNGDRLLTIVEEAVLKSKEEMGPSILRLFGHSPNRKGRKASSKIEALLHEGPNLLSKIERGQREQIVLSEIRKIVNRLTEESSSYIDLDLSAEEKEEIYERVQESLLQEALRECVINEGSRSDRRGKPGKGWKTIRPIMIQVPALPDNVHGSALFARGDTQVLATATLGPPKDGILRDDPYLKTTDPREPPNLEGTTYYDSLPVGSLRFLRTQEELASDLNSSKSIAEAERMAGNWEDYKRFIFQYDFPAHSTGQIPLKSTERRSIGHGALAERAIFPILPIDFPYAIRLTSEVTDSNGSSSMASICGASLALMDAGVPISRPVAGVSVGLVTNADSTALSSKNVHHHLLLDITGTEDHYGKMDLKVGGCRGGITALQLDVKVPLVRAVFADALELAKAGRNTILDEMQKSMSSPRPTRKASAPCVEVLTYDPARKRDLLGPGGVILRQLEDRYAVSVDLSQTGKCLLFGWNHDLVQKAREVVMDLVADVEVGKVYQGTVIEVKDFGAIVELLRNKEGLLHVSELTNDEELLNHPDGLLGFAREHVRVGQRLDVLCIGVDSIQGSIKLSRKALLDRQRK